MTRQKRPDHRAGDDHKRIADQESIDDRHAVQALPQARDTTRIAAHHTLTLSVVKIIAHRRTCE